MLLSRPALAIGRPRVLRASSATLHRFGQRDPALEQRRGKKGKAAKQDVEIGSIEDVIDMEEIRDHLQGALEALKQDLSRLRPGRADAKMLDHLEVSAYGALQPMTAVAQVTVKHQGLVVMPFDPSLVSDIMAAIRDSEMGLGTQQSGNNIAVEVPKLTKETRASMVKTAKKQHESAKQRARRVRNDFVSKASGAKGRVSDDDIYAAEQEIHEEYLAVTKELQRMLDEKVEDLTNGA